MSKKTVTFVLTLAGALLLAACGLAAPEPPSAAGGAAQGTAAQADLAAVKAYALEHAREMKAATEALRATAETYYTWVAQASQAQPGQDPYAYLAEQRRDESAELLRRAREEWLAASTHYELNEGIVAGVPSLAYYDLWLDAGPPAADDPEAALDWQLVLPDGRTLDSPGNFFHNLTEPALYGTNEEFVALRVDWDGDGALELGEVLPDAGLLLASAQGLDQSTGEMLQAIQGWEPTLEDSFGAMVTMIPTMNEYFEQWKLSAFVSGADFEESAFVAVSRLFDIDGILNGLDVTYDNVSPVVAQADTELHQQIETGFEELVGYVDDLYRQEQAGTDFSPDQADLFGSEAQDRATALAAQVAQAAALAGIQPNEADPVLPEGPVVVTAQAPAGLP